MTRIGYRKGVSVWQLILVYAVTPALIIAFLGVLTVGVGWHRAKVTYEPGQAWERNDQLWAGVAPVAAKPANERVGTQLGGAHASW